MTDFTIGQPVKITRTGQAGTVLAITEEPLDPVLTGTKGPPVQRVRVQVEYAGGNGKLQREWFDAAKLGVGEDEPLIINYPIDEITPNRWIP